MSIDEQGFLSPDIATFIAEHRAENQAWFDHARDLNSLAQQLLLEIEVKDNQTLWAALLFVRGLSSFQAAILLAERGMVQDACPRASRSLMLPKYSAGSSKVWRGRARRESDLYGRTSPNWRG